MYAVSIFAFRASAQWKALHSNLNMPILPFTNGEGIIGLFCLRETIPSFSLHDRRSNIKSQLNDAHVMDGKLEGHSSLYACLLPVCTCLRAPYFVGTGVIDSDQDNNNRDG